ncbi:hypothetical protein DFH08DRAFT_151326 [Mycena albidolilacea]|uniref:Uncharacterized protein n=1 Tax=Mycena albidolilacea TaxID=1033008 RepID=A0AAD7A382_9AGAR|nr:hypothetical protein DFH08DRAFT_151326 [Mycena albidolilacea]
MMRDPRLRFVAHPPKIFRFRCAIWSPHPRRSSGSAMSSTLPVCASLLPLRYSIAVLPTIEINERMNGWNRIKLRAGVGSGKTKTKKLADHTADEYQSTKLARLWMISDRRSFNIFAISSTLPRLQVRPTVRPRNPSQSFSPPSLTCSSTASGRGQPFSAAD